jgi:hypothetical protein
MRLQTGATLRPEAPERAKSNGCSDLLAGRECELGIRPGLAVRATRTAGLGASTQGFVNDGLDGTRAAAAFSAAAEAAVDLLGIARKIFRGAYGAADIVVGQDVTGTNYQDGQASR